MMIVNNICVYLLVESRDNEVVCLYLVLRAYIDFIMLLFKNEDYKHRGKGYFSEFLMQNIF